MPPENLAKPGLQLLTRDQMVWVHQRSMEILASVGVRVDSAQARQVFKLRPGARLEDERAHLSPGLVEWAIESAPSTVELCDRAGEPHCRLGSDPTRFGVGVTNLYYQDPSSGEIEPFRREHMRLSVRLGSALPHFDFISTIGVLRDQPPELADLYATLEMVANTRKPLILLISEERLFGPALDLLETVHGDLAERPFVIPYFNPITPLILNAATSDKMLAAVRRGLPVIYSNYGMSGMSTPITPAGTLVLLNAELLAGLTLCQLYKPGAPVILGSLPAVFDMKAMKEYYSPQTMLLNLACSEMMEYYRLPHAGTSGSGVGWAADLPAGGLQWFNHLTSLAGKSGLAPFVGGNFGSKVFSPELAVYSDDVIAQARDFAAGFSLDDGALAAGEILEAGPGGNFLTSELTFRHLRTAHRASPIFPRLGLEKWGEAGKPKASALLKEYTCQLLEEAQPPDDHAEIIVRGEAFIRDFRR